MEWISVKKKLPGQYRHVPVRMKALDFPVMAIYDGEDWRMDGVVLHGRAGWKVDLWYPLPSPSSPKKEGK
ncbi:MAG: hypothetical protein WC736_15965 [Gallionella sp.]|jgi:hypothetical protein